MTLTAPPSSPIAAALRYIALAGNPNCGKTTLFNALTGLRHRVGNYAGVTVERKEGRIGGSEITLLDLPGTYSLNARSPDEEVARDVLLGRHPPRPRAGTGGGGREQPGAQSVPAHAGDGPGPARHPLPEHDGRGGADGPGD